MKEPLVSVIVPNYNHARYLDERIGSILQQTYQHFELIVLDDLSTDNSMEVISRYADDPHTVCVVRNEENSGSPFRQWQKGFALAKGELIWIAESDDSCEPTFLERMVAEHERHGGDCAVSFCRSVKLNAEGLRHGEIGIGSNLYMDGRQFIKDYLSRFNYIVNASSAVFAKRLLSDVDEVYTQFRGCGDWVFWTEIAKGGMVAYVDESLNLFRLHDQSTTSQQTRSGKGELELIRVFRHMQGKGYIGRKEVLHARVTHVYSLRYGKQRHFFKPEDEAFYLRQWESSPLIGLIVWLMHVLQRMGLHVTNW